MAEYDSGGRRLQGQFSVIRVARDDTLNLRQHASPSAPIVSKLAHDQSAIVPTRQVCYVGSTPWYEVRVRGLTGWVNSKYLGRTTTAHDRTTYYREQFGKHEAAAPAELIKKITQDMNDPPQTEGKYEVEVVDTQIGGNPATATLHACCELDDSVAGEQTLLTMKKGERGWRVESAKTRFLCYRGVSEDGKLCS